MKLSPPPFPSGALPFLVGSFGALAAGQVVATLALLATLTRAATLNQVWLVFWLFNSVRLANVLRHHFVAGPLVEKASQS